MLIERTGGVCGDVLVIETNGGGATSEGEAAFKVPFGTGFNTHAAGETSFAL